MSCCGSARQGLGAAMGSSVAVAAAATPPRRTTIEFEYIGQTGLTVHGPASGRRYRFEGNGASLIIDPRDRPALARVPTLRQLA